jgi:hypothetical protein
MRSLKGNGYGFRGLPVVLVLNKSDILAIAFSLFVFFGVKNRDPSSRDALIAFSTVLGGVGLKAIIQAWYPSS